MRINGNRPDISPAEAARQLRPAASDIGNRGNPVPARPDRSDRVELSAEGQARAAELDAVEQTSPSLSAEQAGQIRQRILTGAYDTNEVVDQVARRILDRGEL